MRRNDRKKVYDKNARDYKYQEQERVPEFFEEIYDPIYDESIPDEYYWSDTVSVDSVETERLRLKGKIRYKRSGDDATTTDQCAKDEILKKHSTVHKNNPLSSISLLTTKINNQEEDMPNGGNAEGAEHGSDWEVYHSKYVKKIINKSIIEEKRRIAAAAAASNESPVVVALEEETNTDKQKWVDSSCNDEDRYLTDCGPMVINVDGFFRKNRKAGYGVIIRNRYTGVPFLASAAQEKPVSELYHEWQGVNRGLQLAIKYALRDIYIVHTSGELLTAIALWTICWCEDNDYNSTHKIFCKRCTKGYIFHDCTDEDFELHIYPLIMEIRDNFAMFKSSSVRSYGEVKKRYNKAADYLAKLQLNKEEMKQEFSEELKDILYEEALGGDLMTAIRQSGYGLYDEAIFSS